MPKKVFVSGCYDMLHSGHVAFFRAAAQYGQLYVGIGSDETIIAYKGRRPVCSELERLYMVKAIRYVTDAVINRGSGILDFLPTLDIVRPDILIVNHDGASESKAQLCRERGIDYIVLDRIPDDGLVARSTTALRSEPTLLPTRIDLAGTWIDQPYVSCHAPGWAITASLEPTFEIRERCGLSTSTRNVIRRLWPVELPKMEPETLARLAFCFENDPSRPKGHISGAQDAIGICMPGLVRHYYDNGYWPTRIESCHDEDTIKWVEQHLVLVYMFPRRDGTDVVTGNRIDRAGVERLATAADNCWTAMMEHKLDNFARAFRASFEAQVAMFPGMMQPGVEECIKQYAPDAMAYKMAGAGGGGTLALVVANRDTFCTKHPEAICPKIRRRQGY